MNLESLMPWWNIEEIETMDDVEKRLDENFPLASTEQQSILIGLITKAKKLKSVEEELRKRNEWHLFSSKVSQDHVEYFQDQLETEKSKWNIENLIAETLRNEN